MPPPPSSSYDPLHLLHPDQLDPNNPALHPVQIHPVVTHLARIATIIYNARIRPTPASVPFVQALASANPLSNSIASGLAAHFHQHRHLHLLFSARYPRHQHRTHHHHHRNRPRPPRPPTPLRRVGVFTVARLTAFIGALLLFLRLWLVLTLALAQAVASLLNHPDIVDFLTQVVHHLTSPVLERLVYDTLIAVLLAEDPLLALLQPRQIADHTVTPIFFLLAFFSTPLIAALLCFVAGALFALVINTLLRFAGGLRITIPRL